MAAMDDGEDEGYSEGSSTRRLSSSMISTLIASNHAHLVERGGLEELREAASLSAANVPEDFNQLAALDVRKRADLAYLLMLSLPTPALAELQARIVPLVQFDLLRLLPPELCRSVLSHLDVRSILNASLVCKAWYARVFDDQLLWRGLYESQGWGYDAAAVDWWNKQTSVTQLTAHRHSDPPDEGMSMEEDAETFEDIRVNLPPSSPAWLLPPSLRAEEDSSMQDVISGRQSPNLGLPPSPRHLNHPALRSTASSPMPSGEEMEMTEMRASLSARASSPIALQDPPRRRKPRGSETKTLRRSSHGFQASLGLYGPCKAAPFGFDPMRVSRVHFDDQGKPWVNWRHLFICRTLIERNWRYGVFTMHEVHKPEVRFTSEGPPPPSMHPIGAPHADGVYAIQFDGERLVAGLRGGVAIRYDLRTGKVVKQYRFHTGSVLCLQYDTPETKVENVGDRLVTGSSDGHAVIWDLESGKLLHDLHGHGQSVLSVRFVGDILATCSKDRQIILWSMATGEQVRLLEGHRSAVNAIAFKNGLIASASGDRDVRIWAAETGECLKTLTGHLGGIAALAFDGRYVATGSSDSTVRIVDIHTGACDVEIGTPDLEHNPPPPPVQNPRQPGAPMTLFAAGQTPGLPPILGHAHSELVRTLAFDSRFIVTGSYDETIKVWDRHSGLLILDIHAHSTRVFNLQFDVSRIISCSQAGVDEIRIIDFLPDADVSFLAP